MKTKTIPPKKTVKAKSLKFDILSIFPDAFDSYFKESLVRRARAKKILDIRIHNLRDWSKERHKKVDDRPFGGGPGMVMQIEPIARAVSQIRAGKKTKNRERVILFSTRGKKFTAAVAKRLASYNRIMLICGRYEGVDERVAEKIADEEISMGDYVLSGGELPAMVLVEAVARFLPGFLGKYESLEEIKGSYPVYTRPEKFKPGPNKRPWVVPNVLLSGDHAKIEAWRRQQSRLG